LESSIYFSESPRPTPKPSTRPIGTDTYSLLTYKDIACGRNDPLHMHEIGTDTQSLISLNDRASGVDIPRELLARHVSTDTRTLISTRDNFSAPMLSSTMIQHDAQTQSHAIEQHDAASNTYAQAEQHHIGIQVGPISNDRGSH
jgi:hypothetical protein